MSSTSKRNRSKRAPAARKLAVDSRLFADLQGQIAAIGKAQAVIEFQLDGTIISANENFLKTVGYRLEEVRGQHHSIFVDPVYQASDEYRRFWEKLARGEYDANRYKRIGKGGREVWIQASYNRIMDANGKVYKVVKFATDVTAQVILGRQMEESVAETRVIVKEAAAGDLTKRLETRSRSGPRSSPRPWSKRLRPWRR